jgi:hypothetical protein
MIKGCGVIAKLEFAKQVINYLYFDDQKLDVRVI